MHFILRLFENVWIIFKFIMFVSCFSVVGGLCLT
jgi:hypothetical protein